MVKIMIKHWILFVFPIINQSLPQLATPNSKLIAGQAGVTVLPQVQKQKIVNQSRIPWHLSINKKGLNGI